MNCRKRLGKEEVRRGSQRRQLLKTKEKRNEGKQGKGEIITPDYKCKFFLNGAVPYRPNNTTSLQSIESMADTYSFQTNE